MSLKHSIQFRDRLIKGISPEGYFRIALVKTTDVVRSAKERHNLSLLNTVLLGRTLTASMLLASELKGEERITLRLEGSGPVKMLVAEANRIGEIRGYSAHSSAELDYTNADTSLGDGLGLGLLTVSKVLYNEAEPRSSTIELVRGDVTSDVAHYLAQSEQIPSAVMVDVTIDEKGEVSQAGGLLIQRLPGAPDHVMDELQEKLMTFDSVPHLLEKGHYLDEIMIEAVAPYEVKELDRQPVHFFCRCSKERFLAVLSMLSVQDLREMEGKSQEVVCHFCGDRMEISTEEIEGLLIGAQARLN